MAKSRKNRTVSLTQTDKKGRAGKTDLIELIREKAAEHKHIYVFRVNNMRNVLFKQLRHALGEHGRFLIGKTKVMAWALGKDEASEVVPGASKLSAVLKGDVGLLITDLEPTEMQQLLQTVQGLDYARTGAVADMDVIVTAPEPDDVYGLRSFETGEPIPATCEVHLREAGLPTRLKGGAILLQGDMKQHTICRVGDVLTSNQARQLKIMGVRSSAFSVVLLAHLHDSQLAIVQSE